MKSLKTICIKMIARLRNRDILTTDGDNRYLWMNKSKQRYDLCYVICKFTQRNISSKNCMFVHATKS